MVSSRSSSAIVVKPKYIRKLFNHGRYLEKLENGELTAVTVRDSHPTSAKAPVPICTRSQLLAYKNEKKKTVALVHQYVLPTGELGASGKPDPKVLVHNGKRYQAL
jgi:hypothetical protein